MLLRPHAGNNHKNCVRASLSYQLFRVMETESNGHVPSGDVSYVQTRKPETQAARQTCLEFLRTEGVKSRESVGQGKLRFPWGFRVLYIKVDEKVCLVVESLALYDIVLSRI